MPTSYQDGAAGSHGFGTTNPTYLEDIRTRLQDLTFGTPYRTCLEIIRTGLQDLTGSEHQIVHAYDVSGRSCRFSRVRTSDRTCIWATDSHTLGPKSEHAYGAAGFHWLGPQSEHAYGASIMRLSMFSPRHTHTPLGANIDRCMTKSQLCNLVYNVEKQFLNGYTHRTSFKRERGSLKANKKVTFGVQGWRLWEIRIFHPGMYNVVC